MNSLNIAFPTQLEKIMNCMSIWYFFCLIFPNHLYFSGPGIEAPWGQNIHKVIKPGLCYATLAGFPCSPTWWLGHWAQFPLHSAQGWQSHATGMAAGPFHILWMKAYLPSLCEGRRKPPAIQSPPPMNEPHNSSAHCPHKNSCPTSNAPNGRLRTKQICLFKKSLRKK